MNPLASACDDPGVRFTVGQISEALHPPNAPEVVVHEVRLDERRTGWVIAATGITPAEMVERLNKRAAATSYGVAVADLLRGYEVTG